MRLLKLALEERSDGTALRETEFTFYGKLDDITQLHQARSMEHQEQWEVNIAKTDTNGGKGRIRVRKTVEEGKSPDYVITVKTTLEGTNDEMETPSPTTVDMFDQFKIMSEAGMIKDRYFFPIEGTELVWEVDMFLLPGAAPGSGNYAPWCKIDLEVPSRNLRIPTLPMHFTETIMAQESNRTPEEKTHIAQLYEQFFLTKNTHLK